MEFLNSNLEAYFWHYVYLTFIYEHLILNGYLNPLPNYNLTPQVKWRQNSVW